MVDSDQSCGDTKCLASNLLQLPTMHEVIIFRDGPASPKLTAARPSGIVFCSVCCIQSMEGKQGLDLDLSDESGLTLPRMRRTGYQGGVDAGVGGLVSSSLSAEYLPSQPQTHHHVLQHGSNLQQSMLLGTGSYEGMDHWAARFTSISSREAQGPDQWGAMSAIGVEGTATGNLSDRMLQVNGTCATSGGRLSPDQEGEEESV